MQSWRFIALEESSASPNPQPDESIQHTHFFKSHLNIILPSMPSS